MSTSTTIKLPTYSCKIIISIVDSVTIEADRIYKRYKVKETFGDEAEGALVMPDSDVYYLLIGAKYLTHNTIAHEIFHAAVRVTEDRGVIDEEAQAWLAGYLTAVIY